jgi:WXG100 family type VII secretion target
MTDYKVTPADVAEAAGACDTTAADVSDALAALRGYVTGMEASWQGIAAGTFQDLMAEYNTYATMLHDALVDIGSGLRGNYVNYTESEQANMRSVQAIQEELAPANLT